jgi:hypothetical protein
VTYDVGAGNSTKNSALGGDGADGGTMVVRQRRRARVLDDEALVAAVDGAAQRRMHADIGRDAGEDHAADAAHGENAFEISRIECAVARLVDDDLAAARRQLGDDLPAVLATDENATERPGAANLDARLLGAPSL